MLFSLSPDSKLHTRVDEKRDRERHGVVLWRRYSAPSPPLSLSGPHLFWVWPPPSISGGVCVVVVVVFVVVVGLDSPGAPCARPPDAGPPSLRPKFRSLFFPSPAPNSFFFCLSGCLHVEFWWCF